MKFWKIVFGFLSFLIVLLFCPDHIFGCTGAGDSEYCVIDTGSPGIDDQVGCWCSDWPADNKTRCTRITESSISCPPGYLPIREVIWDCAFEDRSPCGSSCFLPGTQISTPNGNRNIEDLKPGDKVLSFDEKTGKTVENTVEQSIVSQRDEYYVIKTASGKEVKATAEHPFYTGVRGEDTGEREKPMNKVEKIVEFVRNIPLYFRVGWQEMFSFK